jgi:Flp pilus assembly protein TadG
VQRAAHGPPTRTATFRRGEEGFAALEAVIVIPVVIILTMLVLQYVLLWHARNLAQAAAQDGVRVARSYQATSGEGQAAASSYLDAAAGRMLTSRTISTSRSPTVVTVRVHARVIAIVPFGTYTVTESASGPVEQFTSP